MFLWACLPIILSSVLGKGNNIMYCILKSQINGKPFLVLPVEMSVDELPSIIKGDYSIQAYKNRLANLDDSKYDPSRDWLIGMIEQLEREESERGQSEV